MAIKFDSNIIGKRYDRLVVLAKADKSLLNTTYKGTMLLCKCDCGNESVVRFSALNFGDTRSCGCLQRESVIGNTRMRKHNMKFTSEYSTWCKIKERCYKVKDKAYIYYGGRGIKMCDRWLNSFENFYEDMGNRPYKTYSIDRVDVNSDYCKENCRWTDATTQANNKRNNTWYTYQGKTMTMAEWARELGAVYGTFVEFVKRNNIEVAFEHYSKKKILKTNGI